MEAEICVLLVGSMRHAAYFAGSPYLHLMLHLKGSTHEGMQALSIYGPLCKAITDHITCIEPYELAEDP